MTTGCQVAVRFLRSPRDAWSLSVPMSYVRACTLAATCRANPAFEVKISESAGAKRIRLIQERIRTRTESRARKACG